MRYRRSALALSCMAALCVSACLWRRTTSTKVSAQKEQRATRSNSGDDISAYIRGVLKISAENTAAESDAVSKLLESRPDLAVLARRAARDARDIESRRQLAGEYFDQRFFANAFQLYQEVLSVAPRDAAAELG